MRKPIVELIERMNTRLPDRLGKRYKVVPQHSIASAMNSATTLGSELRPDVFVTDSETGRATIVHVKGSHPSDDLPIATLPIMRKVKEANRSLNPDIVLISVSKVPASLEQRLEKDGVHVIRWSAGEDIVDDVVGLIRGLSEKGRPTSKVRRIPISSARRRKLIGGLQRKLSRKKMG